MSDEFPHQVVCAQTARTAGRNYYEVSWRREEYLTDEKADLLSSASETYFQGRFGFGASRPLARAQFMKFRASHHLTISECRQMAKSGLFKAHEDHVEVLVCRLKWAAGWAFFIAALAISALTLLWIGDLTGDPWDKAKAELITVGLATWFCWGLNRCWIWPYARLGRR